MAGHAETDTAAEAPKPKGKRKTLLLAVPVLLAAIGAGLWFSGILPHLLGRGAKPAADAASAAPVAPTYVDVPEIVTNLNVPGRRPAFLKLHAKLELGGAKDQAAVTAAMPRILDLFQTYLRDMRPEELRGSEGSYRLREELIDRAGIAAAPATVNDVLFEELIVQ